MIAPHSRGLVRPARPALLAALAALAAALPAGPAGAVEVVGTVFTVIYRGPAGTAAEEASRRPDPRQPAYPAYPAQPRLRIQPQAVPPRPTGQAMAVAPGMVRLVDARTGAELGRAAFDTRLDGWMFRLPMDPSRVAGGCLSLRSAAGGMLPVREPRGGDDGLSFAHPLWFEEVGRQGEQLALRRELAALDERQAAAQAEQARLQASLPPGACVAPAPQPDPPRPPAALEAAQAQAVAPGVCALRWQQVLGPHADLTRLFQEAGLGADWGARDSARPVAETLPRLRLQASEPELVQVLEAARKGRAFLEHATGVQVLTRVQSACRAEVPAQAAVAVREWEERVRQVRQAPARLLQECETGKQRLEQLRVQMGSGGQYRTELERRVAGLVTDAPSTRSERLEQNQCR